MNKIDSIVQQMTAIVNNVMTRRSDFEKYDKVTISESGAACLPLLWAVSKTYTNCIWFGFLRDSFLDTETEIYFYLNNPDCYFDSLGESAQDGANVYYITEDGVRKVTPKQVKEIIRDHVGTMVQEWKDLNGPLPELRKVDVKFHNITIAELKRLVKMDAKYGDDSLMNCFRSFHRYRRHAHHHVIDIYYRPDRNGGRGEFLFEETIAGKSYGKCGIVYHGNPETGYEVNGAYQLTPSYGWHKHT